MTVKQLASSKTVMYTFFHIGFMRKEWTFIKGFSVLRSELTINNHSGNLKIYALPSFESFVTRPSDENPWLSTVRQLDLSQHVSRCFKALFFHGRSGKDNCFLLEAWLQSQFMHIMFKIFLWTTLHEILVSFENPFLQLPYVERRCTGYCSRLIQVSGAFQRRRFSTVGYNNHLCAKQRFCPTQRAFTGK